MTSIFFFNDTATTEIYTLSLHDALPISVPAIEALISALKCAKGWAKVDVVEACLELKQGQFYDLLVARDRKSTRLNSSHSQISYAVFCLKKKKDTHRLESMTVIRRLSSS